MHILSCIFSQGVIVAHLYSSSVSYAGEVLTSLNKAETDITDLLSSPGLACWELGLDAMSLAQLLSALSSLWSGSALWMESSQDPNHIHKD